MTKAKLIYKFFGLVFFTLILWLSYQLDLHQQYSNYLDTHLVTRQLQQNIDTLKQDYAQKDSYSQAFTEMQTTYTKKMAAFPPAKNINDAFNTVKTTAAENQIQIQSLTPSSFIQKDFYLEVPVQLSLIGSYQSILDFMQKTTSWDGPFFIWKNWTLSHQNKPKTTVLNETQNNDLLQMRVDAIFFCMP